jgi:hypothetical protein
MPARAVRHRLTSLARASAMGHTAVDGEAGPGIARGWGKRTDGVRGLVGLPTRWRTRSPRRAVVGGKRVGIRMRAVAARRVAYVIGGSSIVLIIGAVILTYADRHASRPAV